MGPIFDKEFVVVQADRVEDRARFLNTISEIDVLNDNDPTRVGFDGRDVGYEAFFSSQLFRRTISLKKDASEPLMLAARGQHICRWMIPREDYDRDRAGYLKWRSDLKKFHAQKMAGVLEQFGYDPVTINRVEELNLKKNLSSDPECQTLEDALCLVFLEKQFAQFSERTDEAKMVNILRKTWAKMSEAGQAAALELTMEEPQKRLVEQALNGA